jgi:hypothetical protein
LKTLEGIVIEYRTESAPPRYGVKSGTRYRGSAQPRNVLRIQPRDGEVTEFISTDWIRPPKFGWRKGQLVRVKYDGRRDLYEVVVGDEILQDVATTQQKRKESGRSAQTFAVLLLVVGLPLTVVGYLLSLSSKDKPGTTPPLPGTG